MRLDQKRVILIVAREERRSLSRDPEEQIHADREIRTEHQRTAAVGGQFFYLVQARVPSGRAGDRRDSKFDQAAQVFRGGFGRRKLYRRVDTLQVFRRQPFAIWVIVD